MLNHSRPRIRKRAVLVMYKAIIKYPDILPHAFTRLREKLEDPDAGLPYMPIGRQCTKS